jgi:hypothetical protein
MGAVVFLALFVTAILMLTIWCEKTKLGNRVICWFGRKFMNVNLADEFDDDSETKSYFEYEVSSYRLYVKLDGNVSTYTLPSEKEVIRFIRMHKKMYKGNIIRLEKIMKAK